MNPPFSTAPPHRSPSGVSTGSPSGNGHRPARIGRRRTSRAFATPIVEALASSDAFTSLREGVARLQALEGDLGDCLPDYLRSNVAAAGTSDGVLTLLTPHNALAARLRHLEPKVVNALRERGWAVDALKIRIRPLAPTAAAQPKSARLSQTGLSCLQALRDTLEPSPLRDAIERMVGRHGG